MDETDAIRRDAAFVPLDPLSDDGVLLDAVHCFVDSLDGKGRGVEFWPVHLREVVSMLKIETGRIHDERVGVTYIEYSVSLDKVGTVAGDGGGNGHEYPQQDLGRVFGSWCYYRHE